MAVETIRTYEVNIEGAQSVKELKQEISILRDKLVQLDDTSQDYADTVQDLIRDENKLRQVMTAGKNEVTAATGSYNSLVNEMSSLKKVWREVTSEQERSKIGKRILEINTQLKEMDSTIGNSQRKVGSYEEALKNAFMTPQQELKKLKKELAGLEAGTAEYNAVFQRMAQLTHDVTEQNEKLRWSSADLGDIISNLTGVATGVAGGFSAINAAMGLMGEGTEDVQKAMLKAQQFMQLVQGLSKLEELRDRISGLFEGIKNFGKGLLAGTTNLSSFAKQQKATTVAAGESTTAINTQSQSMGQGVVVTNEMAAAETALAAATKASTDAIEKSIPFYSHYTSVLEENIQRDEELLAQMKASGNANQNEIDALEERIKRAKELAETSKAKIKDREAEIKSAKNGAKAENTLAGAENSAAQGAKNEATATNTLSTAQKGATVSTFTLAGALKVLKTALIATGIGAVIALLGELISLLMKGVGEIWKWISGAKKAEEQTKALKAANEELNASMELSEKAWERQNKLMEAQGKSYEEIYEARKASLKSQLEEVQASLAVYEAMAKEIGARKLQKEKYKEFREELENLKKTEKELKEQIDDLDYDKYVKGVADATKADKDRVEAAKAAADEAKKLQQSLEDAYKTAYQKLKDKYEKEKKILKNSTLLHKKYVDDLRKLYRGAYDTIYNIYLNQEERKAALITTYGDEWLKQQLKLNDEQATIAKRNADKKVGFEKKTEEEIAKMDKLSKKEYIDREKLYNNEIYLIEEERKAKEKKIREENAQGLIDQQRTLLEVNVALAKTETEQLNAKIALAEYDLTNVFRKEGESAEEYRLRIANLQNELKELANSQSGLALDTAYDNATKQIGKNAAANAKSGKGKNQFAGDREIERSNEEYQIIKDNLQKQLDFYNKVANDKNSTDEQRYAAKQTITNLMMQMDDLETQNVIRNAELQKQAINEKIQYYSQLADGVASIFGSIADILEENIEQQVENGEITEEEAEKQFETVKAFQIAQATVTMIAGVAGALASPFLSPADSILPTAAKIALAAVTASAQLAAGIAQIVQIQNTKYGSSSTPSNTTYAVANPTVSDYNPTAVTNVTGQQETESLANALQSNPVKAYVVESEVTAKQELANQRNENTSF